MNGRLSLTKAYRAGSRNAAGSVRAENLGHRVEYLGRAARLNANGRPSLGGGVRGEWKIRHGTARFDVTFHLWPVMDHWATAAGDGERDGAGGDESESECCVCYDQPIDTRLEPCGHVALCAGCASRLQPRRCPLCRADIHFVARAPS